MYGVEIGSWTVPSSSRPGETYTVKKWQGGDHEFSCNCPAWRFVKGGRPRSCAHIATIMALTGAPKETTRAMPLAPTGTERKFRMRGDD